MAIIDGLRDFFRGSQCQKIIKYDSRSLSISGASGGVAGYTLNLGDIKTDVQKIRDASASAEALDDFLFSMCNLCRRLDKKDPRYLNLFDMQAAVICLFTSFRMTLIAFEKDQKGTEGKLQEIVTRMEALSDHLNEQSMKGYPAPELRFAGGVSSDPVSESLRLAGLDRNQIHQLANR